MEYLLKGINSNRNKIMKDKKNGRYGSNRKKAMWPTLGYYIVEKKNS